jgi:hypothetical protein
MKNLKSEYIAMAKLMEQERVLRAKLQAIQEKRLGGGRWTCTERHHNGLVLHIPLPEMMALFPQAKSELIKWTNDDGAVKAYHRFGPEVVCELRPGFWFWVKHETKATEVSPATVPDAAQIAA